MTRRRPAAPSLRPFLLTACSFIAALAAATLLGGCAGPGWYAQAVSGHSRLMRSREPIEDLVARAEDDDPLAARLATVSDLLAFAESPLGLDRGDAYRTLARVEGDAVTWNVVATPAWSLAPKRWCFLVAGCVPYRGYYDRADAERFAERMRQSGRDAAVSPAAAYSTLGWFEDPVLDTMLDGPDADLAETLFHELAHRTLYVKGSSTFNESYATFVAREGVRAWLAAQGRDAEYAEWSARQAARAEFLELLSRTRAELALLYATETAPAALETGKQAAFERLRRDYDELVATAWSGRDRYGGWFDPPPNNADLALIATYTGGLCAFEALWRTADGDFDRFHRLARAKSELAARDRDEWLSMPCPEPAAAAH